MKTLTPTLDTTVKSVCRAFQMCRCHLFQLEACGKLPERPRSKVTEPYLRALVDWHVQARGELPASARNLVNRLLSNPDKKPVGVNLSGQVDRTLKGIEPDG